jgi:hypothetical protein
MPEINGKEKKVGKEGLIFKDPFNGHLNVVMTDGSGSIVFGGLTYDQKAKVNHPRLKAKAFDGRRKPPVYQTEV